jgi:SAM-dependent methyltransferase
MRMIDRILVSLFAEAFELGDPILEIGSHQLAAGDPNMDLRSYFPGKRYIGSDMRRGPGVDQVQDVTKLGLKDGSVGTIVSVGTVEHVFRIFDAFKEMDRVLVDDGALLVTSHMDYGIHGYPSDYWRFTPEAFVRLLDSFPVKLVGYQGLSYHPHAVFGLAFRRKQGMIDRVERFRSNFERSVSTLQGREPTRNRVKRLRRLIMWRVFGSKDAYRKLRDEHTVGWHCISECASR